MNILSLTLTNFKKASNTIIQFNDTLNVFVWANNAWKTSILQALELLFTGKINHVQENDYLNFLVKNGTVEVSIDFRLSKAQRHKLLQLQQHTQPQLDISSIVDRIDHKNIILTKTSSYAYINGLIKNRKHNTTLSPIDQFEQQEKNLIQTTLNNHLRGNIQQLLDTPTILHTYQQNIQQQEWFQALDRIKWNQSQAGIRAKLYTIKRDSPETFQRIATHIKNVFPNIESVDVIHNEAKWLFELTIEEKQNWTNAIVDIHHTWMGMQSLILIVANIFLQDSDIVILDEPEVHMHPSLVEQFVGIIQRISDQKQIIISTHSVPLINSLPPEHIYSVAYSLENKTIYAESLATHEQTLQTLERIWFDINNYTSSLYPRNSCVVFVEWESDELHLIEYAKVLWIDERYYPLFVPMWGKQSAKSKIEFLNTFLEKNNKSIWSYLVILDKDEEIFKKQYNSDEFIYLSKRQIENYLLETDLISSYMESDPETIWALLDQSIQEEKENTVARFIKHIFSLHHNKEKQTIRNLVDTHGWNINDDFQREFIKLQVDSLYDIKETFQNLLETVQSEREKDPTSICDGKKVFNSLNPKLQEIWLDHIPKNNKEVLIKNLDKDWVHTDIKNIRSKIISMVDKMD